MSASPLVEALVAAVSYRADLCREGYVQYARTRGCDRSGQCFESGRDVADPKRGRRRSRPGLVSTTEETGLYLA